jgi:hypothetical protein
MQFTVLINVALMKDGMATAHNLKTFWVKAQAQ